MSGALELAEAGRCRTFHTATDSASAATAWLLATAAAAAST